MSTLAEAKQILTVLAEIETTLDRIDAKLTSGEVQAAEATLIFADLQNAMQDVFSILRQMDLPEEVEGAIRFLQRLTAIANSLRIAVIALNAASGPTSWLLAALGVSASLIYATDMAGSYG